MSRPLSPCEPYGSQAAAAGDMQAGAGCAKDARFVLSEPLVSARVADKSACVPARACVPAVVGKGCCRCSRRRVLLLLDTGQLSGASSCGKPSCSDLKT